jgi:hypothetical protein
VKTGEEPYLVKVRIRRFLGSFTGFWMLFWKFFKISLDSDRRPGFFVRKMNITVLSAMISGDAPTRRFTSAAFESGSLRPITRGTFEPGIIVRQHGDNDPTVEFSLEIFLV